MDNMHEIAQRISGLRDACGYTQEELADELGLDRAVYAAYEENGEDIPISVIFQIANKFGVDFTEILTGNAAKLDTAECIEIRQNNIEQVEKALLRAYKTGLEEIGLVAEGYAKSTCPVDTGRLRNSVTHLLKGYDCFIGTNVEYAPYVEEGTSRMKGKHFLRKAATGHGDTYRAILEKHLRGGA